MGESSRTAYEREKNHVDDYMKEQTDSHMWNHAVAMHGGRKDVNFRYKVIQTFQKALTR